MKIVNQTARILKTTGDPITGLKMIEGAGRTCYASRQKITEDSYKAFIQNCIKREHESPLEFCDMIFEIETSRAVLAELTRHRLASFCVSGDTVVGYDNKNKGITIKELYEKTEQYLSMSKVRSVNEQSKEILLNKISKVFYNGKKETYTIETEDGYKMRATLDHRFLTQDGWKELRDLKVGDSVYTNGVVAYKQKDWLNEMYTVQNKSQQEIGDICGVSNHTIRKWIRKFGLQKPMGSWSIGKEPPNKGQTKENYLPLMIAGIKSGASRKGKPSPKKLTLETGQGIAPSATAGYQRVYDLFEKKHVCSICGESSEETEIHHIDKNPANFTTDNLIELCRACHKRIHKGYSVKAVKPSVIKAITYYGEEDVYDMEMNAPYHNYVADGFVVHNCVESQRYIQEAKSGDITYIQPTWYIEKEEKVGQREIFEASIIWKSAIEFSETTYKRLIDKGCKPEQAREVLPNSTACRLVMKANLREWRHIFKLRTSMAAYPQMRELMTMMLKEAHEKYPIIFDDIYEEAMKNE